MNWAHAAGERRADGHSLDRQEDFFTSQLCRAWFKRFATHVLSRVNTITGVAYRDDPAIFAWELINEPRVLGDASGDILQNWIDEMSAHAKSVDANHMLTVGIEGFWGKTSPHRVGENPIDGAERMGCDFVRNFLNPNLDFASVHVWPDLWLYCDDDCKFEFMKTWIAGHLEESRDTFDKPVLLEEFGKYRPLDSRDRFFREAFRMSLPPSTPVPSHAGGVLFWHMDPSGYPHETDGFSVQLPRDIGETASNTTPFAWCTPFLKDFSRRHSSPALPFQRLTGKTFDLPIASPTQVQAENRRGDRGRDLAAGERAGRGGRGGDDEEGEIFGAVDAVFMTRSATTCAAWCRSDDRWGT